MLTWLKKTWTELFNTPSRVIYAIISVIIAASILRSPERGTTAYLTTYGISLDWFAIILIICAVMSLITQSRRVWVLLASPFILIIVVLSHVISTGQGSASALAIYVGFYWLALKDMWNDD